MTQIEQIKAEIKRLKIEKRKENLPFHALYYDGYDAACNKIIAYLNSLPAEQQSSSLDKFIHTLLETYPTNKNEVPIEALNDYHQGLICGARKTYNWILESAIDGCYIKRNRYTKENVLNGLSVTCDTIQKFKDGDKVKVIVIKEDEQCSTE
jgi:hypothetical protein